MMEYFSEKADWRLIPDYMHEGVKRWVMQGIRPGDFLSAIIENDLRRACDAADHTNQHFIYNYVEFFYNYTPSGCWGSQEKVNAWEQHKGLAGAP